MKDYIKYWIPVLVLGIAFFGMFFGGNLTWLGILTFPLLAILDSIFPNDYSVRNMNNRFVANIPIWLCAVGPVALYLVFAEKISTHTLNGWQIFGGILSLAWMGVIPLVPAAHELYHMRGSLARTVGRYAHLCIFDCTRDIGHVVGHHIDVATEDDGDTAPRGASLYKFTGRAVIESTKYALNMEANALKKKGKSPWDIHHRAYRALLALVVFHSILFLIGGWQAVVFGLCGQLIARFWVESFNYFQHYGLIRVKGHPIGKRHVWNHLGWFSRTVAFEITNHADHHLNSYEVFYKLKPHKEAIVMPSVFVCFLAALIPPIWHNFIIKPALAKWDLEFANADERALAIEKNNKAGWSELNKIGIDNSGVVRNFNTLGI